MARLLLMTVLMLMASSGAHSVLVGTTVVVSRDGAGNYTTISDAVRNAPNNTDGTKGYFVIHVSAGIYEEYMTILENKKYLMMTGDGISRTVITGNWSVVDGWTTATCATVTHKFIDPTATVMAPNFVAVGITFWNTMGPHKGLAIAVITGGDLSMFYRCSFEAYQDTLWMQLNKQFYRECDVYGTIDFIFGDATVVFHNCNIYRRLPSIGNGNMITAQGRDVEEPKTGMSFQNCTIRAANDLASSNRYAETYLGRSWRLYSRVVFMQSFMDGLINPAGWHIWDVQVDLLYYEEYNNRGPGSNTKDRVKWPGYHVIGAKEAVNFTVSTLLQGDVWLPQTGVPYIGGLI